MNSILSTVFYGFSCSFPILLVHLPQGKNLKICKTHLRFKCALKNPFSLWITFSNTFCSADEMEGILKTFLNLEGEIIFQAEYCLDKSCQQSILRSFFFFFIFLFFFPSPPLSSVFQFPVLKTHISYLEVSSGKCFKDSLTSLHSTITKLRESLCTGVKGLTYCLSLININCIGH